MITTRSVVKKEHESVGVELSDELEDEPFINDATNFPRLSSIADCQALERHEQGIGVDDEAPPDVEPRPATVSSAMWVYCEKGGETKVRGDQSSIDPQRSLTYSGGRGRHVLFEFVYPLIGIIESKMRPRIR